MINSGEAGTYLPSLSGRSILSNLAQYTGPLASLRGNVFGVNVIGLGAAVVALIAIEHLRRRRR